MKTTNIVISIGSDIGIELVKSWNSDKINIFGVCRKKNDEIIELQHNHGLEILEIDLYNSTTQEQNLNLLLTKVPTWDNLIFATGTQEPIGDFLDLNFDSWKVGFDINFTSQLRILHSLLPKRNLSTPGKFPTVLFFAGGGTNGTVVHYSSYTAAKIGLIKMCELLTSEIEDTKFSIIGPGWVKTKIHQPTLDDLGVFTKENHLKTIKMLESDNCTPMENVVLSCNWVLDTNSRIISGRNFSSLNDRWGTTELFNELAGDPDMYKLRRHGNSWKNRL
jgi:short-subunit dehydrogenase